MLIRQHTLASPAGMTIEEDLDGRIIEHDTMQCVHCTGHWQYRPGSGTVRGFCQSCAGPTCGPSCLSKCPSE